ncbi:MAG: hypothetical protein IKK24_05790, partial [Clostridia bacterium]|nr:hypothetical protein [Clostridia bacterium]
VLDHAQETGINCLWICPVGESGTTGTVNGYTNFGPHTISPDITGVKDYDEGWERFAWFVRQAHKRNIRILLDVTIWGCHPQAPIAKEHPEYFKRGENGNIILNNWGGPSYDVEGEAFRKWYKGCILDILEKTNIDGFRLDLEPEVTGYEFWGEIRREAYDMGRKIVLMSEAPNDCGGVYEISQSDVCDYSNGYDYTVQMLNSNRQYYLDYFNIVDSVKSGEIIGTRLMQQLDESGTSRFYNYLISCHDDDQYNFDKSLLIPGYQAIFSPFIPVWLIGEELNGDYHGQGYTHMAIDRSLLDDPANREYYETIKKYIRIRRTYTDIFEYFAVNHREANICKVDVAGLERYQAYARYDKNGNCVIIVPNGNNVNKDGKMNISIPFEGIGAEFATQVKITDLMNDKVIGEGKVSQYGIFSAKIPVGEMGIYYVETSAEKKPVYVTNEIGDGNGGTTTETIIENPIVTNKTITDTVMVTESDWLSPVFWIALCVSAAVVVLAGTLLTIYLIKTRRKGRK